MQDDYCEQDNWGKKIGRKKTQKLENSQVRLVWMLGWMAVWQNDLKAE